MPANEFSAVSMLMHLVSKHTNLVILFWSTIRFLKVFIKYLNKIQLVLYAIKHKRCYETLQECEPSMYKHTDNSLSLSDKLQVRLHTVLPSHIVIKIH